MKHASFSSQKHATVPPPPQSVEVLPLWRDHPGDAFIRDEIDRNRKKERWLVLYGAISLILVAILIAIRVVFF